MRSAPRACAAARAGPRCAARSRPARTARRTAGLPRGPGAGASRGCAEGRPTRARAPSCLIPVPASRMRRPPSPVRTSTHGVFPPKRTVASPGVGSDPRHPQTLALSAMSRRLGSTARRLRPSPRTRSATRRAAPRSRRAACARRPDPSSRACRVPDDAPSARLQRASVPSAAERRQGLRGETGMPSSLRSFPRPRRTSARGSPRRARCRTRGSRSRRR